MYRERARDALQRAALPILARIRRDRERTTSPALRAFFAYIEVHLFRTDLKVKELWKETGTSNQRLWKEFHEFADTTPKDYVDTARLDTSKSLLATTELKVGRIGELVGYADPTTFTRTFRRLNHGRLHACGLPRSC